MTTPADFFESTDRLAALVERFRQARVAVVGDYFLDRYLVIDPALDEPSLETGLIARQVVAIRNSPGAAGTVVNNLVALGAGSIQAIGIVGDDAYGFELRRELVRRGVDVSDLVAAADRFTPTYTKPMERIESGERETSRLDVVNRSPTPEALETKVLEAIERVAGKVDAVVVLDQIVRADIGVVTTRVRERLPGIAAANPKTLFFADSRAFLGKFRGVMVKANQHEVLRAVGRDGQEPTDPAIRAAGRELVARTGKPAFVTQGERGILVVEPTGETLAPGIRVRGPIDVVGAGDSVTAGSVLALSAGATLPQAAFVGNLVASITVQQLGTTGTATPAQVLARHEESLGQT